MLETLDAIEWSSLTHAYGKATDVPGVLRSLLSTDQKERRQAISMFYSTILHQRTVYSATAAAVPFLYELLTTPDVQDKSEIAHLLTQIAVGVGYLEVHAVGSGEQTWRDIFAEEGKTLEDEL